MDQRSAPKSGDCEDGQMVAGDTRLFAASMSRKKAEQDAMLLQNRINLLRQEKAKALKKIEETKKRATEILDHRQRNVDVRMTREARDFQKEQELEYLRNRLAEKKDAHRSNLNQVRTNLQSSRKEFANNIKAELHRCKVECEGQRAATHGVKRDIIRTAAIVLSSRRHKAAEDKASDARRQFEGRIFKEEANRKQTEDQITRMEQEEQELIQDLQQTQQRQRAAYDRLEDILQQPHTASRGFDQSQRGQTGAASSSGAAKL